MPGHAEPAGRGRAWPNATVGTETPKFLDLSTPFQKASIRWAASALSGLLLVACFPKPSWHPLVWVACVPLLWALTWETRSWRAFGLGYVCGAVFLAGSCYWFTGVMERYGKLSGPLAWGLLALFVVVFSVFFGAFGLVEGWTAGKSPRLALAASPFCWVAMELARTYLITGFPWNLLGYAVAASGLRQVASRTAVYGLSFLAVATSALLVWALDLRRWKSRWGVLAIWIALLVATNSLLAPPAPRPGSHPALLLQPDVPLDELALEAWEPWRDRTQLERLVSLTEASRTSAAITSGAAPLVVWAENPAPFYYGRDPIFSGAMETLARRTQAYVVFNTVTFASPDNSQPKNSALVLDPEGKLVFQYDKIHLVPFGEYVPAWAFPGKVGKITSEVGMFVPGQTYSVAQTAAGTIGGFICYEAIFPQLVRRLAQAGAEVLVNVSNDAWYGDSPAASQHLEMARLRAIENGRYLLRATNDGLTVVIDPYGRVRQEIPRHRPMVLDGWFDYEKGETFYTAHGDVFAWLCVIVAAGMILAAGVTRQKPSAA